MVNPFEETMMAGMNVPKRTLSQRPPGQPSSGPHTGYGGPGGGPTAPLGQTQGPAGMGFSPPRQLSSGLHTGMGSGEFLSSRYGGGLDDAAGMNENARGMIEGAGFDVASSPGMVDERMDKKLWGIAVNKFPPGSPDMMIQQEWERLKQIYRDKKYGVDTGLELPSRDDIVGLG